MIVCPIFLLHKIIRSTVVAWIGQYMLLDKTGQKYYARSKLVCMYFPMEILSFTVYKRSLVVIALLVVG